MKCMVDAQEGMRRGEMPKEWEARDAVAACSVCGRGLCLAHLVEQEVNVAGRGVSGLASETAVVVLCERCATDGGPGAG
jgi:hypothetical protein